MAYEISSLVKLMQNIERSFRDLSDEDVADIERASFLARMGWTGSFGWDELLRSQRILIVSEAGAGKTYECQQQQKRLFVDGEAAFFLDLATLATSSLRDLLIDVEEKRLDQWLQSQSERATFFLDSIDELKLTLGSFSQALTQLNKAIAGHLNRARIVITTRPVPVDRQTIERLLPIPDAAIAEATAEAFADVVMDHNKHKPVEKPNNNAWRNVGLMPLSGEEIRAFALLQNVSDPDSLLADIRKRDAEEFAQRPQDLIELCADWREHQQVRTHREQVASNIAIKLKPNTERKEQSQLSQDDALAGASRLALAAVLTRKLTLRYNAEADSVMASEAALDVSKVLTDWDASSQATLLERPLFGFASYGRVRFHHRSVLEYLAAQRLQSLLARGVSVKAVKRLLFVETTQGTRAVRPSMYAVAAWLAGVSDTVFDDILGIDPAVVLDHGDPQALRPTQRVRALEAYARLHGGGGWRGLHTPNIQVHRFASEELSEPIIRLWREGIENPEVRDFLLDIIAAGKLTACADIAYEVAMNSAATDRERKSAIDALLRLDDPRLPRLAVSLETDIATWPDSIARLALVALFPHHLAVTQLCTIVRRVREVPRSIGVLGYHLPAAIETEALSLSYLDSLRQTLTNLILEGLTWDANKYPHFRTQRPDLKRLLVAVCRRQGNESVRSDDWVWSCQVVMRFFKDDYMQGDGVTDIQRALDELPSGQREAAFWKEDAFIQSVHAYTDIWHRVFELVENGAIRLSVKRDASWVRKYLSDSTAALDHREMMLWVEMTSLMSGVPKTRLIELKNVVSDAPSLVEIIDNRLKPSKENPETRRLRAKLATGRKRNEDQKAKAHASWVNFWREVLDDPSKVFEPERAQNTAMNLWQAMERSGEQSRASGWNRCFIERHFGKAVTDKLRDAMRSVWRNDRPTLRSERPEEKKDQFLVRWQFGLAAIAAEAEDPSWASKLTTDEAELACRYAPIELNGFPSWLERVAQSHPSTVERVLGEELDSSLRQTGEPQPYSMILQNIRHATPIVAALFLPRIREWIKEVSVSKAASNWAASEQNLSQTVGILLLFGDDSDRRFLESIAIPQLKAGLSAPKIGVWLPTLLKVNPEKGVEILALGLKNTTPDKLGIGAEWFARLFGRNSSDHTINLTDSGFTPQILLKLVRLAYTHVRLCDDAHHEGSYSPDARDHAQEGRNAVLSALIAAKGVEGWNAKIEMANDSLLAHLKDRAIALAKETAAEEADSVALTEADFAVLDKQGEAPPATREEMAALLRDRLDDIDDLLLQDVSPREAWAKLSDERLLRRELARELRNLANHVYTVDQEAATADEKETDIRLRATASGQQAVIELKVGDKPRSAAELKVTLKDQLLTKYMAADECKVGCLIISISSDRHWNHPETNERVDLNGLIAFLNLEAERLSKELLGTVKLTAKGLDLRPRLSTEKSAKLA